MIFVKNTPNNTGVAIYGDYMDFENLYEALHTVVGTEGEFTEFEAARIRVLGVCYDIRHALMGNREIEFVDNGMDDEKKRRMSVLASDKNVYLKIYVLWPEMLFVTMALNDFIRLYGRKRAKKSYDFMLDKQNIWDESIAMVRVFQAAIMKCIKDTVSNHSFRRMMNLMNKDYTWLEGYTWQYLDILNCRFIDMEPEKRLKSISTMAKKIAECGEEYMRVKADVIAAARQYNTYEDNIRPPVDYPEDFEW
ncbi:DUF6904 family protein [Thermincola potens]|uniref:Uncharacterized protein n=1 Tax=Thermincola potens (strain JR) TaxID=635013 RepID=D5XDC3_THEPJ|nr:hypothetical protein [Thermincola potens]ADG81771.1 conserved hypothetical protein [Thermincola potens JR]